MIQPAVENVRDPNYYFQDGGAVFLVEGAIPLTISRRSLSVPMHFGCVSPLLARFVWYSEGGSVVFLVEGYIFKIHRSLITSKSEVFRDMFKLLVQSEGKNPEPSSGAEGSCDEKPIILPQVQARQFRHLLSFFYGVMIDPDYVSLVLGATDEARHDTAAFQRYLDIASLANRYCMTEIEAWARDQFTQVLRSSLQLSRLSWAPKLLLEALAYSKLTPDRELEHNIRNMAESHLKLPTRFSPSVHDAYMLSCIAYLYKYPALKKEDPALFGYIFCVVLSAGHQSTLWKDHLTREDRVILFIAQAYLTPLPTTLPTDWLSDGSKISSTVDAQARSSCFYSCSQRFNSNFSSSFNWRGDLTQNSPLTGVIALAGLATRRQSLAESFKPLKLQCKCTSQLISALDLKMDLLFTEIAEKYHGCLD